MPIARRRIRSTLRIGGDHELHVKYNLEREAHQGLRIPHPKPLVLLEWNRGDPVWWICLACKSISIARWYKFPLFDMFKIYVWVVFVAVSWASWDRWVVFSVFISSGDYVFGRRHRLQRFPKAPCSSVSKPFPLTAIDMELGLGTALYDHCSFPRADNPRIICQVRTMYLSR